MLNLYPVLILQVSKLCNSEQHSFPFICPLFFFSPGDYSYLGSTLRQMSTEPMPSLLDVRQLITLYGILPLGKDSTCPVVPLLVAGVSARVFQVVISVHCSLPLLLRIVSEGRSAGLEHPGAQKGTAQEAYL